MQHAVVSSEYTETVLPIELQLLTPLLSAYLQGSTFCKQQSVSSQPLVIAHPFHTHIFSQIHQSCHSAQQHFKASFISTATQTPTDKVTQQLFARYVSFIKKESAHKIAQQLYALCLVHRTTTQTSTHKVAQQLFALLIITTTFTSNILTNSRCFWQCSPSNTLCLDTYNLLCIPCTTHTSCHVVHYHLFTQDHTKKLSYIVISPSSTHTHTCVHTRVLTCCISSSLHPPCTHTHTHTHALCLVIYNHLSVQHDVLAGQLLTQHIVKHIELAFYPMLKPPVQAAVEGRRYNCCAHALHCSIHE